MQHKNFIEDMTERILITHSGRLHLFAGLISPIKVEINEERDGRLRCVLPAISFPLDFGYLL